MTRARGTPTSARLHALLLGYLGAVVAVMVLAPFRFGPPSVERVLVAPSGGAAASDLVLNLVLFAPLGFLLDRLTAGRLRPVGIAGVGVFASLLIEATQLFVPGRYTTFTDVVTNGAGAWLGAIGSATVRRRIGGSGVVVGRFLLDLPLVGLCWLLVPLLWVETIQGEGWAPTLALAAGGGLAIAAAGRSNAARERQPGGVLWPMVVGWILIATLPAIARQPALVASALGTTLVATVAGDLWWRRRRGGNRRVEPGAVLAVVLSMTPWLGHRVVTGAPSLLPGASVSRELVLEWLALGAGFTALGYAMSEWRGRSDRRWPLSAIPAILLATVAAWPMVPARPLPLLGAALLGAFGSLLFDRQREHIVTLRRQAESPAS